MWAAKQRDLGSVCDDVWVTLCVMVVYVRPQEMADVSAPGSVMVASAVSRSVTERMARGSGSITRQWKWGAPGTVDQVRSMGVRTEKQSD